MDAKYSAILLAYAVARIKKTPSRLISFIIKTRTTTSTFKYLDKLKY